MEILIFLMFAFVIVLSISNTWKTNSPDWWPNDWYKQKLTEQYRRDKNVRQMRKRNNNETNIIG